MAKQQIGWGVLRTQVDELIVLDTVESTNAYCSEHRPPLPPYTLVLTDNQTRGRGRRGRSWDAQPGQSVALSLVVPSAPASHPGHTWLPLVAGAALVASLQAHGLAAAELKWPNDVLVDGRKLAGILCEVTQAGTTVVGIGVNRAFDPDDPPHPRATAISHHLPAGKYLLDDILAETTRAIRAWVEHEEPFSADRALAVVTPVMSTLHRRIRVEEVGGEQWEATAVGLGPAGELLVSRDPAEAPIRVVSSDIEHLSQ